MAIWMWGLFIIIIGQRLMELMIAKSNERWMKARGGVERGEEHYKWFIMLHCLFFMSILAETFVYDRTDQSLNLALFFLFVCAQLVRFWCIYTLGRFWNTKIIVIPRVALIKKGPYKYVKHPNYMIVFVELVVIPLLFGAYITAFTFPFFHLLLLRWRIPLEEKTLAKANISKL